MGPPPPPPPPPAKQSPLPPASNISPFATPNPFAVLHNEVKENELQEKEDKPPPIYVRNVQNYLTFINEISAALQGNEFTCKARTKDIIINTLCPQDYRDAIKYLKSRNAQYHTYQLKEDRAFRVVIRHLHPTTSTDAIKESLQELGYEVRNVAPVLHHSTKDKLPLFFVDLEPSNNNQGIYKLNRLLRSIIQIEEPHKKRLIPQCQRCQQFNHTKGYCNHLPKCLKCADNHWTQDCLKSRDTPAKCALCGGAHPANYRGCSVYSELKRKTKPTVSQKTTIQAQNKNTAPPLDLKSSSTFPVLAEVDTPAYPAPASAPHHHTAPPSNYPSYANVTREGPAVNKVSQAFVPPPSPSNDITLAINSFFTKFETLITPLITLLTTVISALLPNMSQPKP